jgi:4-amino-4-deoxy-L-arabinose transferase-like glycosyltransferase
MTAVTSRSSFKLGIAILLAVGFFLNLWGPPLFDLDEGAFSAATMEMLQRQDFITTYLNGVQRFDKPILIYWLQAISTGIFGSDEFFYRLPSAIAASFWAVSIYRFARPRLNETSARAAVIFMVSSLGVTVIGRAATADALLNLWIALACMDGYRAAAEADNKAKTRAYLWIGLGLLTKGPVAAVVPLATLALYSLAMRDWESIKRVALHPLGWLIAAAVALPWYIAEYLDQGQLFIDGFFLEHNLSRFSDTMEGHGGSIFYYIPGVLLILLPFSVWLVRSLSSVREVGKDKLSTWCWCWFGFVFIFFSFSGTQLPHYILYGSTPLFLMMSRHLSAVSIRWALLPALILPVICVAFPFIVPAIAANSNDAYLSELLIDGMQRIGVIQGLLLALASVLSLTILVRANKALPSIFTVGLIHLLLVGLVIVPTVASFQQAPVKEVALLARQIDEPIIMWRNDMPSFTTYRGVITPKKEPLSGDLVFTRAGRVDLNEVDEILYNNGGILLIRYP